MINRIDTEGLNPSNEIEPHYHGSLPLFIILDNQTMEIFRIVNHAPIPTLFDPQGISDMPAEVAQFENLQTLHAKQHR